MNTFNVHADMNIEDDEDEFSDVEGRPLVGWFLMAVALVAMAFLIGAGPQAVARPINPPIAAAAAAVEVPTVLAFGG
jgi:hypothetical protein